MRALALLCCTLLTACGPKPVKPNLPPPTPGAIHTITTEVRYVPIDPALTTPCPVEPAAALSDAPRVARERRAALEACNAQLAAVRAIQGTPVKPRNSPRNPNGKRQ